jgi:hypothetical protein
MGSSASVRMMVVAAGLTLFGAAALGGGTDKMEVKMSVTREPVGIGRRITDRAAWDPIAATKQGRKLVRAAEKEMGTPIAPRTDELYLIYSTKGSRQEYQSVYFAVRLRLVHAVLAECMENKGRFLPEIERLVKSICQEKTWVVPAHDTQLLNFKGEKYDVDLFAAGTGGSLATCCWVLGDRLSDGTRKLVQSKLRQTVLEPYENKSKMTIANVTRDSNWGPVCLAGITVAGLSTIESPERRAQYVAWAQDYVQHYVNSFSPDGNCEEGIGYWNYGFGHYIILSEVVYKATDGKVDMAADPKMRQVALYGPRQEILPGVFPTFADCGLGSKADICLMNYLSRRFGWGMSRWECGPESCMDDDDAMVAVLWMWPVSLDRRIADEHVEIGPRSWFGDAQLLVCRPNDAATGIGAAMMGGNNGVHHNHNDIGTYVVAKGKAMPLIDPGSTEYTALTFSARRYESKILNSWGHPVPVVAGHLQETGKEAAAKVIKTDFSDGKDVLVLDMRGAYRVEGLEKLERRFEYMRDGGGTFIVQDSVQFARPEKFGTCLITIGEWKEMGDGKLVITDRGESLEVSIEAEGGKVEVTGDVIDESLHSQKAVVKRIGIEFLEPVVDARIRVVVKGKE